VRPDGTGLHQLVADLEGSEIQPDWSPDGERIAFIRVTPADRNELWVVDADGGDKTMLYPCELPCNTVTTRTGRRMAPPSTTASTRMRRLVCRRPSALGKSTWRPRKQAGS
jgi:hypothetical protein